MSNYLDLERDLFSLDEESRNDMTGSMAEAIKFCASFTLLMASSISRWAASLLLVCGFTMATVEWFTLGRNAKVRHIYKKKVDI